MPATSSKSANQKSKGLSHWRKQLLQVSLPALHQTGQKLAIAMRKPDCGLLDLEKIVAEDPVLSFQMLSHANKANQNPDNDVLSLPHAMALLGMDKVKPILKNVKYIHFSPEKIAHNAFLQALNTSLHAATQAESWAEMKIQGSGEAHYWMALRLSVVYWYLALSAPKEYYAIEHRVQTGENRNHVETEILGCTSQQLSRTLLPYWRLTEFTAQNLNKLLNPDAKMLGKLSKCAWKTNVAPEIPKAQGLYLQTPWLASMLAHWLAMNSAVSWYSPQTLRTLKILSVFLHRPLQEVIVQVHKTAVSFSKLHQLQGVWSPAVQLLHPKLPKRSLPKKALLSAQKKASTKPVAEAAKAKAKKDLSVDLRKKVEIKPTRTTQDTALVPIKQQQVLPVNEVQTALFKLFYLQTVKQQQVFSIHQLMDGASQVLHFDLGLTRCILFMKSRKQGSVKGIYAKGFADNSPFASMELSAESDHLLGKLLGKPAALWVQPHQCAKYLNDLPGPLQQALENPKEFVIATISIRGVASGILYADNKGGDKAITSAHYSTFRSLSQAVNHGFGTLAQKKEKEHKQQR